MTLSLPPLSIFSFTVKGSVNVATGTTQLNPNGEIILAVPNPTQNRFELKNAEGFENIILVDVSGRIVRQFKNTNTTSFDISDLPKGVYQVVVDFKNIKR